MQRFRWYVRRQIGIAKARTPPNHFLRSRSDPSRYWYVFGIQYIAVRRIKHFNPSFINIQWAILKQCSEFIKRCSMPFLLALQPKISRTINVILPLSLTGVGWTTRTLVSYVPASSPCTTWPKASFMAFPTSANVRDTIDIMDCYFSHDGWSREFSVPTHAVQLKFLAYYTYEYCMYTKRLIIIASVVWNRRSVGCCVSVVHWKQKVMWVA